MGARILVADDSVTIQKVVELTFSKEDFVLAQARSGEETIREAKETRPDLVLLDLVMPDMNGYDVCAALRAEPALRSVPVILLAGTFESFDRQRAAQVGANDFVTKPFESQVLIGKVKQLLFAKAMEARGAEAAAKLADSATTLTISPAAAAARVAARAPDAVPPPPAQRVAAPPPSQDELWQLLAGPPEPTPPAGSVDAARGEVRAVAGPPPRTESTYDLETHDLEDLPGEIASAADAMDVLPLPESLSLDDLLAASPEVSALPPPADAAVADAILAEPVFELSADASPLPMVEAGKEEPPALSVDDLLAPVAGDTVPADTLTMDLPELDFTAFPGMDTAETAGFETVVPSLRQTDHRFGELSPQTTDEGVADAVEPTTTGTAAPFECPAPIQTEAEVSGSTEARESEPAPAPLGVPAEEFPADAAAASAAAGPVAEEPAPRPPVGVAPSELAAMREAVTERVASDLKSELSEKLLDRFEKIVWEVVPDLAEILITKEIERLRRMAEKEKSS